MGIPSFLNRVLESAGREVDLRTYQSGIVPVVQLQSQRRQGRQRQRQRQRHGEPRMSFNTAGRRRDEEQGREAEHTSSSQRQRGQQEDTSSTMSNIPRKNDKRLRRRPLRIGVDVSTWIVQACQRYGHMLGDERHLTNAGRAELHHQKAGAADDDHDDDGAEEKEGQCSLPPSRDPEEIGRYVRECAMFVRDRLTTLRETCKAEILVVFDGATPPVKRNAVSDRMKLRQQAQRDRDRPLDDVGDGDDDEENKKDNPEAAEERRVKANRRAGAGEHYGTVLDHVVDALRQNEISFLVSPYESDGQLAYLANTGLIDLVVTEDSDLVAHGVSPILYKMQFSIGDGLPAGILYRREYLGAQNVPCGGSNSGLNLLDFSPVMLAVLFVATGCDYCRSLKGIGVVTACDIVRRAFLGRRSSNERKKTVLETVFDLLYRRSREGGNLTTEEKRVFESQFLSSLLMFRHPIVYDPILGGCIEVGDPGRRGSGDVQLTEYEPYRKLLRDSQRREAIVGKIIHPSILATYVAEGWISPKTLQPRKNCQLPDYVCRDLNLPLNVVKDDDDDDDNGDDVVDAAATETAPQGCSPEDVDLEQETQEMETQQMETQDLGF